MSAFLSILIILVCLLLVLVVLVQNSKGGGLASGFASNNQVMGVRRTTDVLEKATWGFAIALFVLAMLSSPKSQSAAVGDGEKSVTKERVETMAVPATTTAKPAAAPAPANGQGQAPQPAPAKQQNP